MLLCLYFQLKTEADLTEAELPIVTKSVKWLDIILVIDLLVDQVEW